MFRLSGGCLRLKERADIIEQRLFFELQDAVLTPEIIDYGVKEIERKLQSSLAGLDDKTGRMRQRTLQVQEELANLSATAALCGPTPALVKDIKSRQKEFDDITFELLSARPDSVSAEIGSIRHFVTGQLGDIRQLLKMDVQKAKTVLEKHVTEIRMVPQVEGKKGHYIAEGE